MVTVKIGAAVRDFESVDRIEENWINQQINGLRGDKHPVCVRVSINEGPLNMTLITANCPSGGGGGRLPNSEEEKAFELWEKLGLKRDGFNPHNLVAFFKQVRKIIGR
jgi:hypothetical protein